MQTGVVFLWSLLVATLLSGGRCERIPNESMFAGMRLNEAYEERVLLRGLFLVDVLKALKLIENKLYVDGQITIIIRSSDVQFVKNKWQQSDVDSVLQHYPEAYKIREFHVQKFLAFYRDYWITRYTESCLYGEPEHIAHKLILFMGQSNGIERAHLLSTTVPDKLCRSAYFVEMTFGSFFVFFIQEYLELVHEDMKDIDPNIYAIQQRYPRFSYVFGQYHSNKKTGNNEWLARKIAKKQLAHKKVDRQKSSQAPVQDSPPE